MTLEEDDVGINGQVDNHRINQGGGASPTGTTRGSGFDRFGRSGSVDLSIFLSGSADYSAATFRKLSGGKTSRRRILFPSAYQQCGCEEASLTSTTSFLALWARAALPRLGSVVSKGTGVKSCCSSLGSSMRAR